ncbi:MAG: 6-phosphogluconolactonase [Phenylobacterium sp.]|uniref:6-phosphogluconolactonase n=1 Tax=Phenylobacterium sp. TaxID=1871053 RepID=UPI001A60FF3E|nr:6-phosphogluconolactonase [Phenylobacterium sp.]MBL8772772.1 6-phosphogluconolactonase [Phenylobacterium sp.]
MIETFPSAPVLADAAAQAVAAALAGAVTARGRASLVATGGRSPGPVYDRLAGAPLDWTRIAVTLSDERCAPPDDPVSNARLVRERLLVGPAARARFLPLWPAPEPAAVAVLTPFDAVMLGMGEDGHVASLIPGDPGLEDALTTADLLRPVPAGLGRPPVARITLTLSALLHARAIFLLVAGETKRGVVERALAGDDLPVGRLLARAKAPVRIFWTPDGG